MSMSGSREGYHIEDLRRAFKEIFQQTFDAEFKDRFEKAGVEYFYTLIDDAVARVMQSKGGFLWRAELRRDVIATWCSASGSSRDDSVLVSPTGCSSMRPPAHGTVQRHYYKYLRARRRRRTPSP
jgi:isocitrate dehydrogenase